jgi:N-glycosylase/DNA lyase
MQAEGKTGGGWSEWAGLSLCMAPETLAMVLDDGQAFRWFPLGGGVYQGIWGTQLVRLRSGGGGRVEWSAPVGREAEALPALREYLALECGFEGMADALPWRSDEHLARCMREFPGLRLLRQPLGETLLCFMCSATKQIPQIKQMSDALARDLGSPLPLPRGFGAAQAPAGTVVFRQTLHALPTWEQVAAASEAQLRACALGFRAGNIHRTAQVLAGEPGWLAETAVLPYEQAHARLTTLPGVGDKIADCVLLYSGTRLCAFPVDTWIIKVMARHYGLEGWAPEQVAHFGRRHFGAAAGLAQQYLFNWERHR